jgi:hypothetical protein
MTHQKPLPKIYIAIIALISYTVSKEGLMGFQKYTGARTRIGDPMVSIWSRGQIGFNQGAMMEFDIDKYQYVVLYFDPDTRRIGFEFTRDENEEGATKLVFRKNSGASFSAIPFLRANKINFKKTTRYEIARDKDSGLLVIDLNKQKA